MSGKMNKKPKKVTLPKGKKSLAEVNPALAKEWHPTKNGNLTPNDVTPGSGRKVWWLCDQGHSYQALLGNRSNGSGCPYCAGKKVCEDNCLATMNPELAQEWHPSKNGQLTPKDVTSGSNKKVWWKCEKGHEWQAIVSNRLTTSCPYCCGNRACKDNCLAKLNPELAKEWHPTKNGDLTPNDVTSGSGRKVWWLCKNGHEWETQIYSRVLGNNCPYCSNRKVNEDNCLKSHYPSLSSEWHPTKNGDLTPSDVVPGSHKRVWWKCKKGHEWQAVIRCRVRVSGCPICANKKRGNS